MRGSLTWLGLRHRIWEKNQNPRLTASDGDSEACVRQGSMTWTARAITAFVINGEVLARVHVSDPRRFPVLDDIGEGFTVFDKNGEGFTVINKGGDSFLAFVKNGEPFTVFVNSGDAIHCLGQQR
ncbi:unnamed protein product [Linum trigynum]|uniref:Uncharacterized protein n=1 Tax=Linum trigynum TaxID=586398 RepID=A0AAV2CFP7_9ROSI